VDAGAHRCQQKFDGEIAEEGHVQTALKMMPMV
jgi:hypothetical protein